MADKTTPPLARGPVPPAPPEIEVAGWAVSGRRSTAPLTIADHTPLAKLALHAPDNGRLADDLGVRLGHAVRPGPRAPDGGRPVDDAGAPVDPVRPEAAPGGQHTPEAGGSADDGLGPVRTGDDAGLGVLVFRAAPGEWLVLGPPGTQGPLGDWLRRDESGTVVDVTHAVALFRLTGWRCADLLSLECAVDVSDRARPNGSAFRSAVAGIAADMVRDDRDGVPSYLIGCEWTFGRYLFDALCESGTEFGIEVDGFSRS